MQTPRRRSSSERPPTSTTGSSLPTTTGFRVPSASSAEPVAGWLRSSLKAPSGTQRSTVGS
ncbi:hypothetical protein BRC71_03990 [Halobacteriales archaeon QH_7_65_31]|nr:MAG: hypothetical protein BRC71_03990 [Halobacteriales archaeon QH_7_65_31]